MCQSGLCSPSPKPHLAYNPAQINSVLIEGLVVSQSPHCLPSGILYLVFIQTTSPSHFSQRLPCLPTSFLLLTYPLVIRGYVTIFPISLLLLEHEILRAGVFFILVFPFLTGFSKSSCSINIWEINEIVNMSSSL